MASPSSPNYLRTGVNPWTPETKPPDFRRLFRAFPARPVKLPGMRIVIQTPTAAEATPWLAGLRAAFPAASLRLWCPGDDDPADYALVWKTPAAFYARPRGLRAAFALGAGVDALLAVTPPGVPLVRLCDAGMAEQMARYVVREVFRIHGSPASHSDWDMDRAAYVRHESKDFAIGVLGLGALGSAVAGALAALGFRVYGWSRTPKAVPGVSCHAGQAGLDTVAAGAHVLVNLLPLTPDTEGVLNAALFEKMPRGAHLINVARGAHLVDDDLLGALDAGRLAWATLDVFRTEPLPTGHAFWTHPRIRVTPHVSARTLYAPALAQIVAHIRRLEAGDGAANLPGLVDRVRGY
jgi:glyoxylate/hydroxypyruvate reductase A